MISVIPGSSQERFQKNNTAAAKLRTNRTYFRQALVIRILSGSVLANPGIMMWIMP